MDSGKKDADSIINERQGACAYTLKVLRRKSSAEEAYWQSFEVHGAEENTTVAAALSGINAERPEDPIIWDCSCLQKKCGACAMVINGTPALACDSRFSELAPKGGEVKVEPLRKFPVIADLSVDRSILYGNLEALSAWLKKETLAHEEKNDKLYEASRCLQCGCCLEVCPNFYAGGKFFGMAGMLPAARLLYEMDNRDKKELKKNYSKHIYSGCGKSLACRNICPAGIDIDGLLVNSNAIILWKSLLKKSTKERRKNLAIGISGG